jgi:phosphoglycolate phosphatase
MILSFPDSHRNINAALFDLDGTLIHTDIDFHACDAAINRLANRYKIEMTPLAGKDAMAIIFGAEEQLVSRCSIAEAESFREEAFLALEKIEASACDNAKIIDGAKEWLQTLSEAGIKIAIVTRNSSKAAAELAKRFDLKYDALLGRDDVRRTKPNPSHLLKALEIIGEPAETSMMTGDHWMDIQAGISAGCAATIGLIEGRNKNWFDCFAPSLIVRSVAEAHRVLGPKKP